MQPGILGGESESKGRPMPAALLREVPPAPDQSAAQSADQSAVQSVGRSRMDGSARRIPAGQGGR